MANRSQVLNLTQSVVGNINNWGLDLAQIQRLACFIRQIDDSKSYTIYFIADHCFNHGYVGKQPTVLKKYFAIYW